MRVDAESPMTTIECSVALIAGTLQCRHRA
jgi:hypothetical protein